MGGELCGRVYGVQCEGKFGDRERWGERCEEVWERVWGEWGSVLGRDMGGGVGKCEVGKER